MKKVFSIVLFGALSLSVSGATVCPAESVFSTYSAYSTAASSAGVIGDDFLKDIANIKQNKKIPFKKDGMAMENLFGCVYMSHGSFSIVIVSKEGKPANTISDIGATFMVQIRPNMKNKDDDGSPVIFHLDTSAFITPPQRDSFTHENGEAGINREGPNRIINLCPAYRSRYVDTPDVRYKFRGTDDGYVVVFSFSWIEFLDRLPYTYGANPVSWRSAVMIGYKDGKKANWGTIDDPIAISWPRGGDALTEKMRRNMLYSKKLGDYYKGVFDDHNFLWSGYSTEKFFDYIKVDHPTFENRNPESDEVYYNGSFLSLKAFNENIYKATFYDTKNGPKIPPAEEYPKVTFDDLYSQFDRLLFCNEDFEALRRDYILAKMLDEPIPFYPKPKSFEKKGSAGKKKVSSSPSLEDDSESDASIIDLDDLSF